MVGKLCAAVIGIAILYGTLKSWLPAWAPLIGAGGSLFLLLVLFSDARVGALLGRLAALPGADGASFLGCVYRAVGILLLTDLARDFCRDAGLTAAGGCVDFAGRVLTLIAIEPMLTRIYTEIQLLTG